MNKPVKVLLIEDSEDDAELVLRMLKRGGFEPTIRRVQRAADVEAALRDERWDAIISDYSMPGFSGIDALAILRATGLDIPFILTSGAIGEETAVEAMKAGAGDYIMKGNLARLAPVLERELKEAQRRAAHREAERALIDSESRFRQMAQNIRTVFFLRDADGKRMLYISPAYEEIWGRPCASLYANPESWGDTIHPDDRAATGAKMQAGVLAGKFELEYRILRPDGSVRWIETRGFPVHDESGKVVRIAGVAEDITGRKQAALELRESERRFSDMLQNVELAAVMLDREARITFCNEYLLRLSGWQHAEVIGRDWFELFLTPEHRHRKAVFRQILADLPEPWHTENEILTRSGERRTMRWNHSVLRSADGAVIGTASIGEDITESKAAQDTIVHLNRVYAVLSGINALIVRARDRGELLSEACRIAVDKGGFHIAWVGMIDKRTMKIVPVASTGMAPELLADLKDRFAASEGTPVGNTMSERAIRTKKPVLSGDLQNSTTVLLGRQYLDLGIRSMAVLPLIVDGEGAGILALYAGEAGFFHEEELNLLTELAGDIGFALGHIEKEQKIARLSRIQALMSGINSLQVRVSDRDELFSEACRIAVEHGEFRMAWIALVDRAGMKVVPIASAGAEPEFMDLIKDRFSLREDAPMGNTMTARVVRGKKAIVSNEISGDVNVLFASARAERGIASMAILPLLVSGEAIGVLALYAAETGFFDDEELKLLTELADDIAFAVDHIDKQERLDYLAYYDALTGLANRGLFLERVGQYMRGAASGGYRLALFIIDLERFKNINDSLGRPSGDALLRQVAEWFKRDVGDANLLARLGADHFAVVLPQVRQDGSVARLLDKSTAAFMEHPFRLGESVFRLAGKTGVAIFPDDGADADTLFKNAEAALKAAKSSGQRYLFYTQNMTEKVADKLTLENQLRQALERGEFVLHYQPKVNMASGKLAGAEALIRWNDPRTGLVPPGRFIPILEETGMIQEVGRWALGQAIADYLRWHGAGLPVVRVAVNVSPLQLRSRGFVAEIEQVLAAGPQAPDGLELEITESLIMEDIKHNITSLGAIRALGVCVAIDDFGTGFSSLSYLAKLPVDTLKIDRSFVIDMTASPEGLALVSTIISLAHSLRLKVVAEGVETEEQSRLLRLLKCDEMQGYLFSKPVPAETFEAKFLAAS